MQIVSFQGGGTHLKRRSFPRLGSTPILGCRKLRKVTATQKPRRGREHRGKEELRRLRWSAFPRGRGEGERYFAVRRSNFLASWFVFGEVAFCCVLSRRLSAVQILSSQGGGTHLRRRSFPPALKPPPSLATANPNGEAVQGKDISPLGEKVFPAFDPPLSLVATNCAGNRFLLLLFLICSYLYSIIGVVSIARKLQTNYRRLRILWHGMKMLSFITFTLWG